MAKKKPAKTRNDSRRMAQKGSGRREVKATVESVSRQFRQMHAKLADIELEPGERPDERVVQTVKDLAEQLQDAARGLREALKNAMMADGKIKPGQVLTVGGRRVFLKPRPNCPDGSTDPGHYDLAYERIQ